MDNSLLTTRHISLSLFFFSEGNNKKEICCQSLDEDLSVALNVLLS